MVTMTIMMTIITTNIISVMNSYIKVILKRPQHLAALFF